MRLIILRTTHAVVVSRVEQLLLTVVCVCLQLEASAEFEGRFLVLSTRLRQLVGPLY